MRSLLALLLLPAFVFADPIDCIPKEASAVITIEQPRKLVESAVQLDAWKSLQAFPQVKDALDTANVRRLLQLLAYVEATTGSKWPDLLDQVAGNGIALGFKPGMDGSPALACIEGKNEAAVEKVYALLIAGIKDEATRNPSIKLSEIKHGKKSIYSVGDDLHYARLGVRTLVSNKLAALKSGIDLALGKSKHESVTAHASVAKAKALAGNDAAAWLWFDLATAKETKEGKDFFENSRKQLFQLLIFGSSVDAAKRSDFLVAGLYVKPEGYAFSLRMPAKRADLDSVMRVHVPAKGIGTKPLLEPPGVVASHSFYLDVAHLWTSRKTVIADDAERMMFEKGIADISKVLPGTSLGEMFEQSGPHHRLVSAHTGEKLYTREPGQPVPPSAYVMSLRSDKLGESLDGVLRAGGLLAGFQTGWKMSETTHDGVKIVSYTFPEKGDLKFNDDDNLRFNAVPSFAKVNDSFVIGSTPGIVKSLIPLLKKEAKGVGSSEVFRFKVYAQGAADVLQAHPDATVTDAVLTQGITLGEARQQTLDLAKWVRTLGTASVVIDHGDEYYRFDATWEYKK